MTMASKEPYKVPGIASDTVRLDMPLWLDIPKPQFQPVVPWSQDVSDQEELRERDGLQEEDAQSVIGVSISRQQTRLMSPRTPAAEKAAALDYKWSEGMFDGVGDVGRNDDQQLEDMLEQESTPKKTQSHAEQSPAEDLPSPWTATPKTFHKPEVSEQQPSSQRCRMNNRPTGILADLNVRRFISSFNLPSLPKTPNFKDFTMPSVSSMLNGTKDHSPPRKTIARDKRANTIQGPKATWNNDNQLQKRASQDLARVGRPKSLEGSIDSKQLLPTRPPLHSAGGIPSSQSRKSSLNAEVSHNDPQPPTVLRRSTSDQSLLLRRVTSTGSSLGDDSRWDSVQDQVNSRFKAIVDSLQDSSIKIPSLPSIPNFHFNAFRTEFTRSRASSDSKQSFQGGNGNKHGCPHNDAESTLFNSQSISDMGPGVKRKQFKSTPSHLDRALEDLTGDVVVMGGYRGSVLRSATPPHRQLWVPVKVGLNIRKVNLEVGLNPEDEESMEESIIPSEMLTHIGPIDMGRRLLKRLRACPNAREGKLRVCEYGYDWRLSPALLSQRLVKVLEMLPSNAEDVPEHKRGATVIAHSMGGLITRYAVNRRPELFAGVVYAGVPQHCINILGPLRNGDEVLLSSKVLTAQVNFTFRTSFLLLPEDGKCFVDRDTKEEFPVDFFNMEHWKDYAFSPCIAPALPSASQPEKKGLLGSVSGSLTSLPLPGKKSSSSADPTTPKEAFNQAATKIEDAAHPISTTLAPQPNSNPSTHTTFPLPLALTYLTRTLSETLAFKRALGFQPSHSLQNRYPPFSTLYSTSVPTVFRARVSTRDGIRRADAYDDLQFASGDGVCLARAAMLPEGYSCAKGGRVRTERGHVGLLGDLEGVGRCLVAIGEARRRGVGLGLGGKVVIDKRSNDGCMS